jgi:hypothetical protein
MPKIFPPLTPLRGERLAHALRLADVAREADFSLTRASIVERDPDAHPEDARTLREAIRRLAEREVRTAR